MSEFEGVVHEVGEDLPHPRGIAGHSQGRRRIHEDAQFHTLGLGLHAQHGLHILHHRKEVEVQGLEDQLPRLDLGEVQDVVDEREQGLAAGADGVCVLALFLAQGRVQQQAGHADDAVHGRADLVAHVGQELALEARQLQRPIPGLGQFAGSLLQLDLSPATFGDVVVLPQVAQIFLAHQDGHEVPGEDAPVHQGDLVAQHRGAGRGHLVLTGEERGRIQHEGQALLQQVAAFALYQHVGRHRHLEHLAEGLVEQGDAPPLGLHQNARLHVLDQGPQAAGGHAEDDLRMLPVRDVVERARNAQHHAGLVVGDALMGLHPLHVAALGGHPELALEDRLTRVHGIGEQVQIAGIVRGQKGVQEGLTQPLLDAVAGQLPPGRVEEGPLALAVDLENNLFQVT